MFIKLVKLKMGYAFMHERVCISLTKYVANFTRAFTTLIWLFTSGNFPQMNNQVYKLPFLSLISFYNLPREL